MSVTTVPATAITIEHETLTGDRLLYVFDAGPISREDASDLHWMLINGRCTREATWVKRTGEDFLAEATRTGVTIIHLRHRPAS